jgi:NAD(P)-dependent dehydrogenase (short-subunit alcohol dehydrogenase family)
MLKLEGKIAIITGSDSGMGQAMAEAFAREGADVGISFHTDEAGAEQSRASVMAAGRRAIVRQLDVTSEVSVAALFEAVDRELGLPPSLSTTPGLALADRRSRRRQPSSSIPSSRPIFMVRSSAAASLSPVVKAQAAAGRSLTLHQCMRRSRVLATPLMVRLKVGFSCSHAAWLSNSRRCGLTSMLLHLASSIRR